MAHGVETGKFGRWLTEQLAVVKPELNYRVFFDHGQLHNEGAGKPETVAIKGFYGEQVSNANRLADIDIAVVNANNRVKILIEIEERESSPKKIVGDVFTIAMCNHIEVKLEKRSHVFAITSETTLIVAGVINPKGSKLAQLQEVLSPRIQAFSAQDGLLLTNVKFLFTASIQSTLVALEASILQKF